MSNRKVSRRNFIKYLFSAGIIGSLGGLLYSYRLERFWLDVHHEQIELPKLPTPLNGLTIVQFTDLHLGFHMDNDNLDYVVTRIQREQPDMICFTGDFCEKELDLLEQSIPILLKLEAPLGKFAVLGNHDHWLNPEQVVAFLTKAGFTVLMNQHVQLELNGERFVVAGVDSFSYHRADLQSALKGAEPSQFTMLLAHEPDFADKVYDNSVVQLQLSGHSHGGQIRFPIVGALVTPLHGKKYVDRLNQVGELTIYTSRGIGTTGIPFRFMCRPELSVLKLVCTS